jgi:hypothetical protein
MAANRFPPPLRILLQQCIAFGISAKLLAAFWAFP